MAWYTTSLLFLIITLYFVNAFEPKVGTPLGVIKGYHKLSRYGSQYQAYEGIPYALPPVGQLRFQSPQPVTAWADELQATKLSDQCIQYIHLPSHRTGERVQGSEDCLYLNVYVPDREDKTTFLPVIFWIHGGAFIHGSGNVFGAKYLMDEDVILVTLNYRLGPLGFLSTEDDVVPGNMGLKDQSMALNWVHDNIEYFGGDYDKITLVGLSAGGASVHYHYLSPLSANLFQNGISISGTALNCWAQTENALEKAKKLGALMGCPTENPHKMVACLRLRPARAMVQAVENFMPWLYNPFTPFGPVVEKSGTKPFIDRPPVEILQSGHVSDVPWITGVTSEEGLYPVAEFAANEKLLKELDKNWESLAPYLLDFNYTIAHNLHAETAIKIRQHYMENNPINQKNLDAIIKMVGDRLFVVDAEKAARMQAKVNKSPVWFYYYAYRANGSLSDTLSGTTKDFGVSHGDDAFLVLDNPFVNAESEDDRHMQGDLIFLWSSFAEKGTQDLTPDWKSIDPSINEFYYLHISEPREFYLITGKNFGRVNFWSTISFAENIPKSYSIKDEL